MFSIKRRYITRDVQDWMEDSQLPDLSFFCAEKSNPVYNEGIVTVGNNLFLAEQLCRPDERPMHNATFPFSKSVYLTREF